MRRILLTAFEPFLEYPTNASQLILQHWAQDHPGSPSSEFTTEILPVDYELAEPRIQELHESTFDFAIHLGQSPRIDRFNLEMVALNLKSGPNTPIAKLNGRGPAAYTSQLPLESWCEELCQHDIPSNVSFHAGTYLCNAAYFWSTEVFLQRGIENRSLFVHVPLITGEDAEQEMAIRRGSRMLTRLIRLIEGHLALDQPPTA